MPTSCKHFALLDRRLSDLSKKFVDDQVQAELADPTTFLPDMDALAAYRLLFHAEIEDFLEEKAKEHLSLVQSLMSSGSLWMKRCPSLAALSIMLERPLPPIKVDGSDAYFNFAKDVLAAARKKIGDSNGIKVAAFIFLSLCAGKAIDEVDDVLMNSLNSYGKLRGDVAHKSVTHTSSLLAPSSERKTAFELVKQLGTYFDVCP